MLLFSTSRQSEWITPSSLCITLNLFLKPPMSFVVLKLLPLFILWKCQQCEQWRLVCSYSKCLWGGHLSYCTPDALLSNQAIHRHSGSGSSAPSCAKSFQSQSPLLPLWARALDLHFKRVGRLHQEAPAVPRSICLCYYADALFKVSVGPRAEVLAGTDYIN